MGEILEKDAFLNWINQAGNFAIFDYAAGEHNYQAYKDCQESSFLKVSLVTLARRRNVLAKG